MSGLSRRVPVVLLVAAIAASFGCGAGGVPEVAPVPGLQTTTDVFAESILHYADLEVLPEHLATLVPFGEERVPARIVYDGVEVLDVGLRLKGGVGSARPLSDKSSFSIKTNEFVSGQKLHGFKKFTFDSEVQDPTLLAAHVGYEVFRRAGLPTRRTAFARVTFNGTYYGVYLVAEGIDSDFVKARFERAKGNLYEGEQVDVTEPERMDLETNEDANDRSDLEGLRDLLATADDATLLASLAERVDLGAFFRYWACEDLCDSWDGYTAPGPPNWLRAPNNYFVYDDPDRGLVWIPHGIDQIFGRPYSPALAAPTPAAVLAARLFATTEGRARRVAAVGEMLDTAWDADLLRARLDAAARLIEGSIECAHPGSPNLRDWRIALRNVRSFLELRAGAVFAQLEAAED